MDDERIKWINSYDVYDSKQSPIKKEPRLAEFFFKFNSTIAMERLFYFWGYFAIDITVSRFRVWADLIGFFNQLLEFIRW